MKHLKVCIILLSFIIFVTCFLLSAIEPNEVGITTEQIAKLNSALVNPTEENADEIIKYVTGLKLNNQFFTSILKDKYLTDYGKCVFIKELNDFIISSSDIPNTNIKTSLRQIVITNASEIVKDDIIIKDASLIDTILDGTTPENADKSIYAINGLYLEDTVIKSIIDMFELSDYNKILIIKQIINSLINNSGVKGDEMKGTWGQSLGVPTVASQITTPYVPTTTPYVPTTTPYVPTTTPYVPTTTPYVPTTTPYVPTTTPYVPTTTPTPIAYYVQHSLTGKYLDLNNNSLSMSDYTSAQSTSQQWMYTGNKELKNKQTNTCLDSDENVAYSTMCTGVDSQKWNQQNNTFKNVKTTKLLDSNGTDVYVRPYNSEDSQKWTMLSSTDAADAEAADAAAVSKAKDAKNAEDNAKIEMEKAATAANVPIGPGSAKAFTDATTARDNANDYANKASTAATDASTAANSGTAKGRTAATAAETSATKARDYANAANYSLTTANEKADAAAAAAAATTAAATTASAAVMQAKDAEAVSKATYAKNAEDNAKIEMEKAKNAAQNQGSEENAKIAHDSANNANDYANKASTAATEASTAANSGTANGRTAATAAETSAKTARYNADAARGFADTANQNKAICYSDRNNGVCSTNLVNSKGTSVAMQQSDGQLVIYKNGANIWGSGKCWDGREPYTLKMQGDGNLVVYGKFKQWVRGMGGYREETVEKPCWAANGKSGDAPYRAILQDDNNFVVYDKNNKVSWASGTYERS